MQKLSFLEKIFSVKNSSSKTHKIVTVLGIKFKVRRTTELKKQLDSLFKNVRKNSILIVEPNDCHYEVIPGYAKYLLELGYNVDIVVCRGSQLNFLSESDNNIRVFSMGANIKKVLEDKRLSRYKYLLFTSTIKYVSGLGGNSPDHPVVTDYFEYIAIDEDRIIFVQHHLDRKTDFKNQIALADLHNQYSKNFVTVNPHYFGNVKVTSKNENVTKFIVVGHIRPWRKNYDLLLDAVRSLSEKSKNFKIIVVGDGKLENIDDEIARFFDIRGRLTYKDMFKAMEEADFFLCLLDPENDEHHRYVTVGTSGSFQLVYGFGKPCLIQKKFADVYDFNNANALVYEKNADLADLMYNALTLDAKEYKKLQQQLAIKAEIIRKQSLENLKKIVSNMD